MRTEIISINMITDAERQSLYELFQQFYANTDYARFLTDFSQKNWLIRMMDGDRLAGFSTQQLLPLNDGSDPFHFLFSGDTIVHPDYWNQSHLAGAFTHLFLRIADMTPTPLYWLLICKGFRTYRFLPVFFKHFHPHHAGLDAGMRSKLDAMAAYLFGSTYHPDTGLIVYENNKDYLIEELAGIPDSRRNDPHVSFFEQTNPSYRCGTELACIAPLSIDNLTRCGIRVNESTKVEWHV